YLISDHLGTPQLAINSTGEQSWKINSDAFGNSELDANNQITMNLRFPGQYYDAETGLSYNYFRDYDAKTGRYIESDPIGLAGGINTYGYVGGNPIEFIDPFGLAKYPDNKEFDKEGCEKLKLFIEYDDHCSSPRCVIFSRKYHAFSFKEEILGLNKPVPSIGGDVDIDWMLRSSFYGYGRIPGVSILIHGVGKGIWNIANRVAPTQNMDQERHQNAAKAAYFWLSQGLTLREIFEPAIETCQCKYNIKI
ncbi:RHS repeat-associated core domain-containing protein, partial [Snodgrassella communis]|uniref:RHS repeat-associated core domain-containing protein n=1 Tax=Snodgrassella communis TaxID=2946699 RepID=UPI00138E1BAF